MEKTHCQRVLNKESCMLYQYSEFVLKTSQHTAVPLCM